MSQQAELKPQDSLASPEDFPVFLETQRRMVEGALKNWFSQSEEEVIKAVCYSLLLPSKRIRPLFCLETCFALSGDRSRAMPAAMALEMVHTYSLIHDDLPAMDNDDLRRGQPTNHKVFGEATALLAGSALLTSAFEVLSLANSVSADTRLAWILELARASGGDGMVLGQHWDMKPAESPSLESLARLHKKKTGALLAASVVMGAQAAGASTEILEQLRSFAFDMGLAFQIRDDVLDVIGGAEIGKPILSDEKNSKTTYVSLLGIEGAQNEAEKVFQRSIQKLQDLKLPYKNFLEALTRFVVDRKL